MVYSNDQNFFSTERTLADEIRDSHKALSDLWQGVTLFSHVKNCVTVYGSARFKEDHVYYNLARSIGKALAQNGFAVMTGGGPGVMEAANRGAKEGGGLSLGCNIKLPFEQKLNPYIDEKVEFELRDFFCQLCARHSTRWLGITVCFSQAQHVHQQSSKSDHAQHIQQPGVPVKKSRNEMEVPTQEIASETPAARPENRARDVVRREGPPGHLQDTGDDSVQLP